MRNRFVLFPLLALLFFLAACERQQRTVLDANKPTRPQQPYFDKKYLLYKLSDTLYSSWPLSQSFTEGNRGLITGFKPLGYNPALNLQYTHIYSPKCVYHVNDSVWKYAEVCYPNTCLTNDNAYAQVSLRNSTTQSKKYYLRLFYQNTTYWYPTDSSYDLESKKYLDNYYGSSQVVVVELPAQTDSTVSIPYMIGMNAKGEYDYDPSKDPARPGNYEFMVLAKESNEDKLLSETLDLKVTNPFAEVKWDELNNSGKKYFNFTAYTGAHHFKFVFLEEYFDGTNDLTTNHIYIAKNGHEKKLCDTCSGWFKGVINENWTNEEFFEGYIKKAGFVQAEYGVKGKNFSMDTNGIVLTMPKSKRGDYKKTWGEFLFGPSFKYGHLTVRAKFSPMMTKHGTTNGIVHNLWLYQRDPDTIDRSNPYHDLDNGSGKQPYEIDFEIWSSSPYDTLTLWDDESFINYSIVDYMRNANVQLKPGEQKKWGNYDIERYNRRQASVLGKEFKRDFFNDFHTYEMYWYPDRVRFMVDGKETAVITKDVASIPDKYMFLWIGSPMYQDGTYYMQSHIPFLKYDKHTIVDYIKIE
jgi:beta-glucanase (GH16 family)